MDGAPDDSLVGLIRTRLDAGAGYDEVLGTLREQGFDKGESRRALRLATDMSHAEVKLLVHRSPVWADRRQQDEEVEDEFFRALFIMAVVGEAEVNQPEEWRTEVDERRRRAREELHEAAAHFRDSALTPYRQAMDGGLLGQAFAALVAAGQRDGAPDEAWQRLTAVSDALCLGELRGETEPAGDDADYVRAAHVLRGTRG